MHDQSTNRMPDSAAGYQELDPLTLERWLDAGLITLVDVREANENAAERIPGGVLRPMSTLQQTGVPTEAGKPVAVYCRSGNRSAQVGRWLVAHGSPAVYNLTGGILAWRAARLETEADPDQRPSGLPWPFSGR